MDSAKPFNSFPCIHSRDVEEVRSCLTRIYGKPTLVSAHGSGDFSATINACQLADVGFCYGTFGAAVRFEFPETGLFCQLLPIRGKGEVTIGGISTELAAGAGAVISADAAHKTNISPDYEHIVLRIGAQALAQKLAAMIGAPINEPLRMNPRQDWGHPAARMLRQYIPLLVDTLSGAAPPFPPWWVAQTEQLVMTLFLCGHQHNYSHCLEQEAPEAAPYQVRKAEEYIEANAQRAVTLEELAEVTGVSAFSLFRSFKKSRGYSPMTFATQLRLKRGGIL